MTIYNPRQVQEVMQQLYNENTAKRLKAMKIAKHISTLTSPIIVRVDMLSDLYSHDFKVSYNFTYGPYDVFNSWLTERCNESNGGNLLRVRNFVFKGEVNGEDVEVDVVGYYEEPQW